jgi:hypothetical protein
MTKTNLISEILNNDSELASTAPNEHLSLNKDKTKIKQNLIGEILSDGISPAESLWIPLSSAGTQLDVLN